MKTRWKSAWSGGRALPMALALALAGAIPALPQNAKPFTGRWDLTVTVGSDTYASWLEVTEKAGVLQARAQQRTGNVAPVAGVKLDGKRLLVTLSPAAGQRPELVWELTEKGGKLTGVSRQGKTEWQLAGVRAPAFKHAPPKVWANPEPLFHGKDLAGWEPVNNTPGLRQKNPPSRWVVRNGELTNEAVGSNLRTTRTFQDFKLHVEFACPPGENSGVYLRGRYEAQVTAAPAAPKPGPPAIPGAKGAVPGGYKNPYGFTGCIYGMLGPATPPPYREEWQTYDFTLVGRWVTVIFNGVVAVDNQEIAGPTGGALDSHEGEPGPIYFQGDHHGGVRYRNITIAVPKK